MNALYNKFKSVISTPSQNINNEDSVRSREDASPEEANDGNKIEPVKQYTNILSIYLSVGASSYAAGNMSYTYPYCVRLEKRKWNPGVAGITSENAANAWSDLYEWFFNTNTPAFRWQFDKGEHVLLRKHILTWKVEVIEYHGDE